MSTDTSMPAPPFRFYWLGVLAILVAGLLLRIVPSTGYHQVGVDETFYRVYILFLERNGLEKYPAICDLYIKDQSQPGVMTMLPPTRFFYILCSWIWKRAEFGDQPGAVYVTKNVADVDPYLISLKRVSCTFSCLTLLVSGLAAYRILGRRMLPAVLALMSFSPLQIHMGQHGLIDGFFMFWALTCLWLLWENLRHPDDWRFLAGYAGALALMVLTKENSFFVYVALGVIISTNRWTGFGKVTPRLLLVSVLGPLVGVFILVMLAGGTANFIKIYTLLVSNAQNLTYAVKTGDGPWYRYLVDLLLISPLVLCLAIAALFTQLKKGGPLLYLTMFIVFTYAVMCNVRYSMNLRYATIWELSLRALAAAQIWASTAVFGSRQILAVSLAIAALCAYDLHQYTVFFVDAGLYELVSEGLLRAVKILK